MYDIGSLFQQAASHTRPRLRPPSLKVHCNIRWKSGFTSNYRCKLRESLKSQHRRRGFWLCGTHLNRNSQLTVRIRGLRIGSPTQSDRNSHINSIACGPGLSFAFDTWPGKFLTAGIGRQLCSARAIGNIARQSVERTGLFISISQFNFADAGGRRIKRLLASSNLLHNDRKGVSLVRHHTGMVQYHHSRHSLLEKHNGLTRSIGRKSNGSFPKNRDRPSRYCHFCLSSRRRKSLRLYGGRLYCYRP